MISSKKNKLSRRGFIKGMGAAAGSMTLLNTPFALAQSSNAAPVRLLIIPLQHGWGVDRKHASGRPSGTEFNFTLPRPLQGLNSVKDQVVLVDSLRTSFWGNAHDVSYADILTCSVHPDAPSSSALGGPFMYPTSPSIDWMIGNQTQKGVLRLSNGYRSWGAQFNPTCFSSNLVNLPFYTTAASAYNAVIEPLKQMQLTNPGSGPSPQDMTNDALLRSLKADGDALVGRLSGTPRTRMETYLSAVTALGQRILMPGTTPSPTVTLPPPPGMNPSFAQQLDHYFEMVRVCFMLDTHRVAVLGLGEGASGWQWTNSVGQIQTGNTFGSDFHHQVAHYNESADPMAAMHSWTNWYAQKVAAFVQTLKTTIDVDGRPMIDNTIIVLTGEIGNGNHDRENHTHIVIGGGGAGRIRRNRWISLPTFDSRNRGTVVWGAPRMDGTFQRCDINWMPAVSRHHLADLWVSVGRLCGLNISKFGFDAYNYQPIQLT